MDASGLISLLTAYRQAPPEYQATSYWQSYEKRIMAAIEKLDLNELRSGKYPLLASFGFNETRCFVHPNVPLLVRVLLKLFQRLVLIERGGLLPYQVTATSLERAALHYCQVLSEATGSVPVTRVRMSRFGNPAAVLEADGQAYTVQFLCYFARYCFANRFVRFTGNEVVVELGSGAAMQAEVLAKAHPGITVLCFDLPAQLFVADAYLRGALGEDMVVGPLETLDWADLSGLRKGRVHLLGNWKFPLIAGRDIDLFWNAASFGEMEPEVVQNYLSQVRGGARHIYLLNSRHGKELHGRARVRRKTCFDDYVRMLEGYQLLSADDAYTPVRALLDSGGYFEAIWRKCGS